MAEEITTIHDCASTGGGFSVTCEYFCVLLQKGFVTPMETFKGKVHQVTESVLTPRRLANDPRKERVRVRLTLLFDADGHKIEELHRDRKHANRITYKYNKKCNCVEQNEFNTEHRLARRFLFKYDQWGNQIEEQGTTPKAACSRR